MLAFRISKAGKAADSWLYRIGVVAGRRTVSHRRVRRMDETDPNSAMSLLSKNSRQASGQIMPPLMGNQIALYGSSSPWSDVKIYSKRPTG
jgi:hypothetical protein